MTTSNLGASSHVGGVTGPPESPAPGHRSAPVADGRAGRQIDWPRVVLPVLGLLLPIGIYLLYVAHYSVDAIYWDDWNLIPLVHAGLHDQLSLTSLWAQHNENRMLLPNLLFVLFGLVDHFDTRTIMIADAVIYCLSFLAYARLYRGYAGRRLGFLPALAIGLVWFSFEDFENSLWAFQLAWFLIILLLMGMLLCLSLRHLTPWMIAAAAACAVAASVSSIQGLILWPVGLLCLVWRIRDRRNLLAAGGAWLAATIVTFGAYFSGFNFSASSTGGGSIAFGLRHPRASAHYVLIELGNVFPTGSPSFRVQTVCGAVIAALILWVLYGSVRHHREPSRIPLPLAAIGFGLCFDGLTALGRLSMGMGGALASRYTMANLLVAIGIATYFLDVVSQGIGLRSRRSRLVAAFTAPVVVVLLAQVVVGDRYGLNQSRSIKQSRTTDAAVVVNLDRVPDAQQQTYVSRYVYPSVQGLAPFLTEAQADHLSVFSTGPYRAYRKRGFP